MQYLTFCADWTLSPASTIPHRDFRQALSELCVHLVWSQGPVNVEISQDIHYSNLSTLGAFFPS